MPAGVTEFAHHYKEYGFSIVPVRGDGSKAPTLAWKRYQKKRIDDSDIDTTFADTSGIAIICGQVSGGLEVIDFDEPGYISKWEVVVSEADDGLLARLPTVVTPSGGTHIYFRSQSCEGNLKLAWSKGDENSYSIAIETRGEGGYVLAPGCSEDCHQDGGTYEQVSGPPISECPVLTDEERAILLTSAYSLNEKKGSTEIVPQETQVLTGGGDRPGDQFNKQANWVEVLRPAGWSLVRKGQDGTCFWQRPGKDGTGGSATTGHCASEGSGDLLYVFSSNAEPFESERAYSKFAAHSLINFNGDFSAASRSLLDQGYGCDPDILQDVKQAIDAHNTILESGVDLDIPQDTIDQLKQIDGKFKRTWEMKRQDFGRDVSRYDTSIIWYCCEVGLDIKTMVSVLYKFRVDRGIIEKHPLMPGSIAAKIARINDNPDTHDSTLMKEELTEVASSDDIEHMKAEIRGRLGFDGFSHLEQHGRDDNTIFYMVATDGTRVKIGSESKLMMQKGFAGPILRWFHVVIQNMKGWRWDAVLRLMLQTCVVDEMPDSWESNQMEQWVEQYLRERPVCDDENWKEAALHGLPFEVDGKLHLHIEGLMKWIALTKWGGDGKIASHTVRSLLKTLGFQHEKRNIWIDGKSYCRSFWTVKREAEDVDG